MGHGLPRSTWAQHSSSSGFHAELNHCLPSCVVDVVDPTSAPPNPHSARLHRARSQLHEVQVLRTGIHSRRSVSVWPGHKLKHEFDEDPKILQRVSEKGGGSTLRWFHTCGSRLLWTWGKDLSCCPNDEPCFQLESRTLGFQVRCCFCSYPCGWCGSALDLAAGPKMKLRLIDAQAHRDSGNLTQVLSSYVGTHLFGQTQQISVPLSISFSQVNLPFFHQHACQILDQSWDAILLLQCLPAGKGQTYTHSHLPANSCGIVRKLCDTVGTLLPQPVWWMKIWSNCMTSRALSSLALPLWTQQHCLLKGW